MLSCAGKAVLSVPPPSGSLWVVKDSVLIETQLFTNIAIPFPYVKACEVILQARCVTLGQLLVASWPDLPHKSCHEDFF